MTDTKLTPSDIPNILDHKEINPYSGQQLAYVVLTEEERSKGFVRPVRRKYRHVGVDPVFNGLALVKVGLSGCGKVTTMSQDIAETYARDPKFYTGTFCVSCHTHLPLEQFVWYGTTEIVGS